MYCVVRNCSSTWTPNSDIKFHSFPKNQNKRNQWLADLQLKTKFYDWSKICSLHFHQDDYINGKLRKDAVPQVAPLTFNIVIQEAYTLLTPDDHVISNQNSPPQQNSPNIRVLSVNSIQPARAESPQLVRRRNLSYLGPETKPVSPENTTPNQDKLQRAHHNSVACQVKPSVHHHEKQRTILDGDSYVFPSVIQMQEHMDLSTESWQKVTHDHQSKQPEQIKSEHTEEHSRQQICRVCFAVNCNLYSMAERKLLKQAYETLTGLLLEVWDKLPPFLCMECTHRLLNCARFRGRCLRAHSMLMEVAKTHDSVNQESVDDFIKNQNPVSSTLGISHYQADTYDLVIKHVENSTIDKDACMNSYYDRLLDYIENEDDQDTNNNTSEIEVIDLSDDSAMHMNNSLQNDLSETDTRVDDSLHEQFVPDTNVNGNMAEDFSEQGGGIIIKVHSPVHKEEYTIKTKNEYFITRDEVSQECTNINNICLAGYLDIDADIVKTEHDDFASENSFHSSSLREDSNVNDRDGNILPILDLHDSRGAVYGNNTHSIVNGVSKSLKRSLNNEDSEKDKRHSIVNNMKDKRKKYVRTSKSMIYKDENYLNDENGIQGLSSGSEKSQVKEQPATEVGMRSYECNFCKKTFTYTSSLKNHLRIHEDEGPFSCNLCEKLFFLKTNLIKHFRVHSGENPCKIDIQKHFCVKECYVGKKTFKDVKALRYHLKTYSEVRPFSCNLCYEVFHAKYYLSKHLKIHSGGYSCNICKKTFATKQSLRIHTATHSGNESYVCPLCNKAYYSRKHLRRHSRIHSGDTHARVVRYKTFTSAGEQQRRFSRHTGSYPCKTCGKTFRRRGYLTNHLYNQHVTKDFFNVILL